MEDLRREKRYIVRDDPQPDYYKTEQEAVDYIDEVQKEEKKHHDLKDYAVDEVIVMVHENGDIEFLETL